MKFEMFAGAFERVQPKSLKRGSFLKCGGGSVWYKEYRNPRFGSLPYVDRKRSGRRDAEQKPDN